jgi:hypothetical protein
MPDISDMSLVQPARAVSAAAMDAAKVRRSVVRSVVVESMKGRLFLSGCAVREELGYAADTTGLGERSGRPVLAAFNQLRLTESSTKAIAGRLRLPLSRRRNRSRERGIRTPRHSAGRRSTHPRASKISAARQVRAMT